MDPNERLLDETIRHALRLHRFGEGVAARIVATLREAEADVGEQLRRRLERARLGGDPGPYTTQRLRAVLESLRELVNDPHRQLLPILRDELEGLAAWEGGETLRQLRASLPPGVALSFVRPSPELLIAAVEALPFTGGGLRGGISQLAAYRFRQIEGAVRLGVVEGETVEQIVRRIVGTAANGYRDGVLDLTRKAAAALARTSVAHVANRARMLTFEANRDFLRGVMFVATLDSRTTPLCGSLDGRAWASLSEARVPPLHYQCRSTLAPVLRPWRELGIDGDDLAERTRASWRGQAPQKITFADWLRRNPDAAEDVLGPERAKLFLSGRVQLGRFVDEESGRLYSLAELKRATGGKQ